jgi:hypothetical protein
VLTKIYAGLVLSEDRWFKGGLAAIVAASLVIWSLLAGWPISFNTATSVIESEQPLTKDSPGTKAACTVDANQAAGTVNGVAETPAIPAKGKAAPVAVEPAVDEICAQRVAERINRLFQDAQAGIVSQPHRNIEANTRRLCAVGRGGIEGLPYPSHEAWLVGAGHIDCSFGERLAVRTVVYRFGLTSARFGFWATMLFGFGLFVAALWFCWRTYATREALKWLDVSEHP